MKRRKYKRKNYNFIYSLIMCFVVGLLFAFSMFAWLKQVGDNYCDNLERYKDYEGFYITEQEKEVCNIK